MGKHTRLSVRLFLLRHGVSVSRRQRTGDLVTLSRDCLVSWMTFMTLGDCLLLPGSAPPQHTTIRGIILKILRGWDIIRYYSR